MRGSVAFLLVTMCLVRIQGQHLKLKDHVKDNEEWHQGIYTFHVDLSKLEIEPKACVNLDQNCKSLAAKGFCNNAFNTMMAICPHACRFCSNYEGEPECKDLHRECGRWARTRDCLRHPAFMKKECNESCHLCGQATNKEKFDELVSCPQLAKHGYCKINDTIKSKCKHSCEVYEDVVPKTDQLPSSPYVHHPLFQVTTFYRSKKLPIPVPTVLPTELPTERPTSPPSEQTTEKTEEDTTPAPTLQTTSPPEPTAVPPKPTIPLSLPEPTAPSPDQQTPGQNPSPDQNPSPGQNPSQGKITPHRQHHSPKNWRKQSHFLGSSPRISHKKKMFIRKKIHHNRKYKH